jgi:hypothetical protein
LDSDRHVVEQVSALQSRTEALEAEKDELEEKLRVGFRV